MGIYFQILRPQPINSTPSGSKSGLPLPISVAWKHGAISAEQITLQYHHLREHLWVRHCRSACSIQILSRQVMAPTLLRREPLMYLQDDYSGMLIRLI